MPQPYSSQVHIDQFLTNVSVAYMQQHDNFIASKVFPSIPVDKQSNKYAVYTKNDWFRDEAKKRSGATESAGSGYNVTNSSYYCDVFSIHKDIDKHTRANADAVFNMEKDATEFVTQRMLLRKEVQWAADAFSTSIWGTDSTPTNLWSDQAASTPLADLETGKSTILSATGFEPNTLVLGYDVFKALKQHPDIIDRFKYTSAQSITPAMIGAMIDVPNVYVAKAVKATNVEGETAAYSFVQGKHALLCYVNPNPSLLAPSAGYTFEWTGVSGSMGEVIGVSQFELQALNGTIRVEADMAFDHKVVGSDLGYFFASCVA